jgi:hypothetical protein
MWGLRSFAQAVSSAIALAMLLLELQTGWLCSREQRSAAVLSKECGKQSKAAKADKQL